MRLLLDTSVLIEIERNNTAMAGRLLAAHDLKGDRAQVFDALIATHANSLKLPVAYVDGDFNRFAIKKLSWAASAGTRKTATAAARQR